ncbi:MAG TPA: hypothetical protein VHB77_06830 [Planctomycetaceae bacterium]|nr:hypothetical protein [Planctomycetaceae bacterium]
MYTVPRYLTHKAALRNRAESIAASDCPGRLKRRLFSPNSRTQVCTECGAMLFFDVNGRVYIASDRAGRPAGKEVIQAAATEPGPSS